MATDASGNVYVTGSFLGSVDFGGGAVKAGFYDLFVASYTASGAYRWAWSSATNGVIVADSSVAVDAANNVFITGSFEKQINFGAPMLRSAGKRDVFFASFTSSGAHRWSGRYGAAEHDLGRGVACHGTAAYFTGHGIGSTVYGPSYGGADVYLLKVDLQAP